MFYIINQRNQIIAADNALLSLLNIDHIDDLTKQIILGDTQLNSISEQSIEFITNNGTFTYTTQTSTLSSLLGDVQLVQLSVHEKDTVDVSNLILDGNDNTAPSVSTDNISTIADNDDIDDLILVKDEAPIFEESQKSITPTKETEIEELSFLDNTRITKDTEDNELFDLTIPNAPQISIDKISLEDTAKEEMTSFENLEDALIEDDIVENIDTTPIIICIDEVSENIGISSEDYRTFLNEYIDTSISLENDLKSSDTNVRTSAINTLTQLAEVLELPMVNNIISELTTSGSQESKQIVDSFYTTLSRLTTEKKPTVPNTVETNETKDISLQVPSNGNSLNLEGIQPIHFDFQLKEAADDLSLPVELIEEFVHDFIEQAHIETEKMLEAYEKGDLDAIQKIGHILKGASSNLRINALSDTLYNIQFCEEISQLEGFIKKYWGHFLSFEQQIDVLSKKGDN